MKGHADFSDRRQIIVFSTPGSESGMQVQRSVDALRCQLIDRDTDVRFVDIVELAEARSSSPEAGRDVQDIPAELARLRSDEQPDFELVLIGKDGGVKARTDDPNALEDFLAQIDTMPMRRAEMRSRDDTVTCSHKR